MIGAALTDLKLGRSGYDATTDTWYVQLDQLLPGTNIPVWRGTVDVVIKKNRIIFFSVNTVPGLDDVDVAPAVTKPDAVTTAQCSARPGMPSIKMRALPLLPCRSRYPMS